MEVSSEQQDIIDSDGNTIVIANPGTGKTTTLSLKVIKLLKGGVNPEDILCITFTAKAKNEMYNTIYNEGKDIIPPADIMKINIHTFHSFANDYLRNHDEISGDILGNNFLRFLILNYFVKNSVLHYGKEYIISDTMPKTENAIRYIKNFGIVPDKIDIKKVEMELKKKDGKKSSTYTIEEITTFLRHFVEVYREYEETKPGKTDYTDMLLTFREKFHGDRFEYVLVDEMQDMNEIEAKIAEMVAKNLFLVGDAKQAIFGFQGGSIKNFDKFKETYEKKLLATNRRSAQQILDYAKEYFLRNTRDRGNFEDELRSFKSGMRGEIPKIISTNAIEKRILETIQKNSGKEVGIIMRNNGQIIDISKVLDMHDIEYVATSSQATTQQARDEIQKYLKGLLSDKMEDKISGTYAVFSKYTLREAFGFSQAFKSKNDEELDRIRLEGVTLGKNDLDGVFDKTILPVCASKGAEWFETAMSVKQVIDEYLALGVPTFDGLFDFIAIGEESRTEQEGDAKVTLTTVHKAKGRQFDVVAYVPTTPQNKTSFIDTIVEAILLSCGIDVVDEVEEESLRVDFVAFTRAKEKLVVIADHKTAKKYHVENLADMEVDDSEVRNVVVTRLDRKLSKAFALFVEGRHSESEALLKQEDDWLRKRIKNYFENVDHFSYSAITTDPFEFLKRHIICISHTNPAAELGSSIHTALEKILRGTAKIENYEGETKKAIQNALDSIDELKQEMPGLQLDSTEKKYTIPLRSVMDCADDDTMAFTGKIDAIFKHDKGYLIVDYKTGTRTKDVAKHRMQLAIYRKMLSIAEEIPEEQISMRVIFVALRGGINTGRFDREVDSKNEAHPQSYRAFERGLQTVLEWKNDPDKFIDELLEKESEDELNNAIKENLARS